MFLCFGQGGADILLYALQSSVAHVLCGGSNSSVAWSNGRMDRKWNAVPTYRIANKNNMARCPKTSQKYFSVFTIASFPLCFMRLLSTNKSHTCKGCKHGPVNIKYPTRGPFPDKRDFFKHGWVLVGSKVDVQNRHSLKGLFRKPTCLRG